MEAKKFNVGDKVFAKVKGYPPWPALITGVNKTNYDVQFYGTGEVAAIKAKSLYYFLRHREKFIKSHKRKEYLDAVEQISVAIAEDGGVDGSTGIAELGSDSASESGSFLNSTLDTSKSNADLLKSSSKKKYGRTKVQKIKHEMSDLHPDEASTSAGCTEKMIPQALPETISPKDSLKLDENYRIKLSIHDIIVITPEYLYGVRAYFEHVKKFMDVYQSMAPEERPCKVNELFLVKTVNGEFVGIKYNRNSHGMTFNSAYDQAEYDYNDVGTVFDMKSMIENGEANLEDRNVFETNLDITDSQIEESIEMAVITNKKQKLNFLKIENKLAELDTRIKKSLSLDKANPVAAIKFLNEILTLDVKLLMMLKHPGIFEMAKRLCRYVGNIQHWNYTNEESQRFEELAEKVREVADAVYSKFVGLLDYKGNSDPWEIYLERVGKFKNMVKHDAEFIVYALTSPPFSRAAFFDNVENGNELAELVDRLGNNKLISVAHVRAKRRRSTKL